MPVAWRRLSVLLAAALVALPGFVWTLQAGWRSTYAAFGRDTGIFQYVAWALSRGERAYVQVRDINGPLVPAIHLLFLKLGGADEHVFRSLCFALFSAVSLFVGATLPGIGRRKGEERLAVPFATRVAWALAAWVVLGAGYLIYGWWEHGQREDFFDDFLLPALALQLRAQLPGVTPRARRWLLVGAGALGAVTWFGKPSCFLYSAGQAAALLLDDEMDGPRRARIGWLAAGWALGCIPMLAFLFAYGDIAAGARIMLFDVWRLHRYIWHKSVAEGYFAWNNAPRINYALATLAVCAALLATRALPRRFLVVLVLPVAGLANFFLQAKGFPYHLHPVVAGTHLVWLAGAAYFVERAARELEVWAAAALGFALGALGYQAMTEARLSPSMHADWLDDRRAGGPDSERFLRHFTGGDYFAWDLHRAAAYVAETTEPTDRIQTYGMDPYFLFLARRLSATPYIYNFQLDVDSALAGNPPEADRRWMVETEERNANDLYDEVTRKPPGAFVNMDRVPYTFPEDSDADFAAHCPQAAEWMRAHYRLARRFGTVRVWLREDLYARAEGK